MKALSNLSQLTLTLEFVIWGINRGQNCVSEIMEGKLAFETSSPVIRE